jgi:hypothetical protein
MSVIERHTELLPCARVSRAQLCGRLDTVGEEPGAGTQTDVTEEP